MGRYKTSHKSLFVAAALEDIADIDAHVANGENVNEELDFGRDGFAPLIGLMAGLGKVQALRRLVEIGAKINAKDSKGMTALQLAIIADKHDTVAEMLRLGADPNLHTGALNYTALHTAANLGNTETVKLLLAYGGDPHAKGNGGITPLLLASHNGFRKAAELLSAGNVMRGVAQDIFMARQQNQN